MYTKEELEQMELSQLLGIAKDLGIKVSQNDELETVIYAILDKAAEQSAADNATTKRKRTRITKKDTDRVYTVNGKDGENFDVKSRGKKTAETPSLFSDAPVVVPEKPEKPASQEKPESQDTPEKPAPKKRGRKSKAELAAIAAAEAAKAEAENAAQQSVEAVADEETVVPEAAAFVETPETPADEQLIEQLQQKVKEHNQEEAKPAMPTPDGVWEGDPGDGTDFIIVEDLPIEDHSALPSLDIFDRPMVQSQPAEPIPVAMPSAGGNARYDFGDMITGNGVLEILQDG